jgi:lipoate-protein ligase A
LANERTASYPPAMWRLVLHGEADGATNMAVDEAILSSVVTGASPPTLRFYAWSPPCLSLGRSQPLADVHLETCRAAGVDVVRRPTGGRAILHADELTYSLALLQSDPRAAGDLIDSYRRLSEGLMAGLQILGVGAEQVSGEQRLPAAELTPVCFETPSDYEITVNGRKLVGSAQWRARGGVLQHGSLPLQGDLARIVDYVMLEADREEQRFAVRARATTLNEALGRTLPFAKVAQALANGFAQALNLSLVHSGLTERERLLADKLRRERYAASEWTART